MTKDEIAILSCRLLGLVTIVSGFVDVARIPMFETGRAFSQAPGIFWLPSVAGLVVGAGIFFGAEEIGKFLIQGFGTEGHGLSVPAKDVQRIAYSVVGLVWLTRIVPSLIMAFLAFRGTMELKHLIVNVVDFVLALCLFFGPDKLVALVKRLRDAGTP